MSVYTSVLVLAQLQAEAAARDDLDTAARLFERRATLLDDAPAPEPEDASTIRQILLLDRQLSSRIRERMIAIRDEAISVRRVASVQSAYAGRPESQPRVLERFG